MELISRSVLVIVLISIIIKALHKTHFGTDVQCSKHNLVEVIMRGPISAAIMSKETCYYPKNLTYFLDHTYVLCFKNTISPDMFTLEWHKFGVLKEGS